MKNKSVLITGGTTGIGLATAQLLKSEGARVVVTGRNPTTLAQARDLLGPDVVILASDSGSLSAAEALGQEVRKHVETVDAVFLNAGVGQFAPFEATSVKQFDDMFSINVRGPFFQLQGLLPLLSNPSAVVFNASVVSQLGLPNASVYAATKAAVVSLGKSLAVELAPRGIRVNTVSPGPVSTPIYNKLGMGSEAQRGFEEMMAAQSLVKRFGTSEELAKLIRFLLSADSAFIVGEDITIDGGYRLT